MPLRINSSVLMDTSKVKTWAEDVETEISMISNEDKESGEMFLVLKNVIRLTFCSALEKSSFKISNKIRKNKYFDWMCSIKNIETFTSKPTLGIPGIQLANHNIHSKVFPSPLRGKQALDCILVAFGYYFVKPPLSWSDLDLDEILKIGTQVHIQNIQKPKPEIFDSMARCFIVKNHQLKVNLTPPIILGGISSSSPRHVNLEQGLIRYFTHERFGVFMTPEIDLLILKDEMFYVFDPRPRLISCDENKNGKSSLIALGDLHNIYYLIMNLSGVNEKSPFKICKIEVEKLKNLEKYSESRQKIQCANRNKDLSRKSNFRMINEDKAFLFSYLHYHHQDLGNTEILFRKGFYLLFFILNFHIGKAGFKQSIATSIISIIYSKIDPPNSWSSKMINRVFHLGKAFYADCVGDELFRNLKIMDLPSMFNIGAKIKCEISIFPEIFKKSFEETYFFFDNEICKGLRAAFGSNFDAVLVQIDVQFYSIWSQNQIYCLFDGFGKTGEGFLKRDGKSCLMMTSTLDQMCEVNL